MSKTKWRVTTSAGEHVPVEADDIGTDGDFLVLSNENLEQRRHDIVAMFHAPQKVVRQ